MRIIASLLVALLLPVATAQGKALLEGPCFDATRQVEQETGVPDGLLYALALTESARWDRERGASRAWPWTVRNGADGYVLEARAEALDLVERLRTDGRSNIDVGCMQINLHYHPKAFASMEEAFDPLHNARYAADLLKRLRAETRSWAKAVERYHTRDRDRGRAYRKKVYAAWEKVRRASREMAAERYAASRGRGSIVTAPPPRVFNGKRPGAIVASADKPGGVLIYRPQP